MSGYSAVMFFSNVFIEAKYPFLYAYIIKTDFLFL